jgi:hypothetical protein
MILFQFAPCTCTTALRGVIRFLSHIISHRLSLSFFVAIRIVCPAFLFSFLSFFPPPIDASYVFSRYMPSGFCWVFTDRYPSIHLSNAFAVYRWSFFAIFSLLHLPMHPFFYSFYVPCALLLCFLNSTHFDSRSRVRKSTLLFYYTRYNIHLL